MFKISTNGYIALKNGLLPLEFDCSRLNYACFSPSPNAFQISPKCAPIISQVKSPISIPILPPKEPPIDSYFPPPKKT